MVEVGAARFEELVAAALDGLPADVAALVDNVAVVVEDRHDDEPHLLGLYEGVPLTERDGGYGLMTMPDRITVFRLAVCGVCADEDEVVDEVRTTVVHELGHHLGIDEDRLHELGWG